MKICPNCNASNGDSSRTCQECSMPLTGVARKSINWDEPIANSTKNINFKNSVQQNISENIYDTQVKKYLSPKDGKIHVLMLNSFSKWLNQNFGVEDKYTVQIDNILIRMQSAGYEILDVKFSTEQNQGLLKEMEGFYTLITYK